MSNVFISVCIPAYKRIEYLKRLLDSISIQRSRDFEVIVTDDSPSDDVRLLCKEYENSFPISYYKNEVAKGSPENWNEAIRHARGEWIKLMHDDDWFASPDSLSEFTNAVNQNSSASFFYSAYSNVFESDKETAVFINAFRKKELKKNPVTLFSKNVIGPPSVTLVRNDKRFWYDTQFKWLVDIDFYIRYLKEASAFYINKSLIKVGVNEEQVTKSSFRVASIEIPENFYLLDKVGIKSLKNILVYDTFWRMIRNLKITTGSIIRENGYTGELHLVIQAMIKWQATIPAFFLQIGIFSKIIMWLHYLLYRRYLE